MSSHCITKIINKRRKDYVLFKWSDLNIIEVLVKKQQLGMNLTIIMTLVLVKPLYTKEAMLGGKTELHCFQMLFN